MRWGIVVLAAGVLLGCSIDSAGYGGDCVRSTECNTGLVCIEGTCTNDLSLIEDPGEVPELTEPDAGAAPIDAAAPDAAAPVLDAQMPEPVTDAAMPVIDAAMATPPDAG